MLMALALIAGCGGSVGGSSQEPDPVVVDIPIAYVKRALPVVENNGRETFIVQDLRDPALFNAGAALFIRDRASSTAQERNITARAFSEPYDVKDLQVSYDATKLLFAMRAPQIPNADDDEQPTWNIWEYDRTTDQLHRIISSDTKAEAGQDIAPHYLRDGRIVFSSTRQRQSRAILLDEGKPQYAGLDEDRQTETFVLHVMDADGENIEQITYNQSHDLDPVVMDDGRILFSRWDNAARGPDAFSLYSVNPDGTQLSFIYGYNSHDTGSEGSEEVQFVKPQLMPDGQALLRLQAFENITWGGSFSRIDIANFSEHDQPVWQNIAAGGSANTDRGQTALFAQVRTDDQASVGGRFSAVYPLIDGTRRLLTSWSQCRMWVISDNDAADGERDGISDLDRYRNGQPLIQSYDYQLCSDDLSTNPLAIEASPRYGIWVFNPDKGTRRPVISSQQNIVYSELLALEERNLPLVSNGPELSYELAEQHVGILNIRSVYDLDGVDQAIPDLTVIADPSLTSPAQRPLRFIRLVKAVSRPNDDLVDFGNIPFTANRPMREILGYAPIEPDGSVKIKVPADVAFSFDILDANGHRVAGGGHSAWLQLRGGEERKCVGCHAADSQLPHGRLDSEPQSVNAGAAGGLPFPNTDSSMIPLYEETMAETLWRIRSEERAVDLVTELPALRVDLSFTELWGNDSSSNVLVQYSDYIDPNNPDNPIASPVSGDCIDSWSASCRVVINYETHVKPLWKKSRVITDAMDNIVANNTCTVCHGIREADDITIKLAAAQLNLSDDGIDRSSYEELFQGDNEQILADGTLQDREEDVIDPQTGLPLCATDPDTGEEIRDPDTGLCTEIVTRFFPVAAPMSANGALASRRFFSPFLNGPANGDTVDHRGMLTPGELKLLAEWLDIGAQYYNNPFDVPVN